MQYESLEKVSATRTALFNCISLGISMYMSVCVNTDRGVDGCLGATLDSGLLFCFVLFL